jgi:hypothetical protein
MDDMHASGGGLIQHYLLCVQERRLSSPHAARHTPEAMKTDLDPPPTQTSVSDICNILEGFEALEVPLLLVSTLPTDMYNWVVMGLGSRCGSGSGSGAAFFCTSSSAVQV